MPVVFAPQKGEEYVFYEWKFCFSNLFLPGGIAMLFLKLDMVCAFAAELAREWIHTTPYLFSLLWKDLSCFSARIGFSYS